MDVALLIVGILLLVVGVGFLGRGILRFLLGRARLIDLRTWLNLIMALSVAVGTAVTVVGAINIDGDGNGENGPIVQPPTSTPSPSATPVALGKTPVVSEPTPTLTRTPTHTPAPSPTPAALSVTITKPRNGDSVPLKVMMEGESSGVAAGRVPDISAPWIYVVMLPLAGTDPNQDWWVQPYPRIGDDGGWSAFIFVGVESDVSGTPFEICAITSDQELKVGRVGKDLPPALTQDCVYVTRE